MTTSKNWLASSLGRSGRAQLGLASAACVAAGIVVRTVDPPTPAVVWLSSISLFAAGLLVQRRSIGAQLLARSMVWSNFVLGFLITLFGPDAVTGFALAGCTGGALLAAGRLGLGDDEASRFRPVAFRRTLGLAMVLAVADAQMLGLFGALAFSEGKERERPLGALLLALAAILAVAIFGLYRLRTWGLVLGAAAAAGIAVCALGGFLDLGPLDVGLGLSAIAQVLLTIPVFVAIARRRAPAPPRPSRLDAFAIPLVVAGMLLVAAVGFARR